MGSTDESFSHMVRVHCVEQSVIRSVEPIEQRASRSVPRRKEHVRCRDPVDRDGCSEAQYGAGMRLYSEGCREHLASPKVTGGPESGAPRVERAQEGQDAEITAMRARRGSGCSSFMLVEMSSWMEDVSVAMKLRAEKASLQEDESLETVMILMSLDLAILNFNVAELPC